MRFELFVPGVTPADTFDLLIGELEKSLPQVGYRFTPGEHGRLVEARSPASEQEFARVTAWEPGRRVIFSWRPVEHAQAAPPVSVEYRFEPTPDGTKVTVEYGEWDSSTPLHDGSERIGWFASVVLPSLIRATSPLAFGDWWTDRVARRPSGPAARKTYADPMYHWPNFLYILDRLHLTPRDRLLEVGCGGGAFLREALKSGCRAWAVDHSPDMVVVAREQNREAVDQGRAVISEGDSRRLPFDAGSCTCAVTTGSFGFWDHPVEGLAEIRRVLEPGGRFILFTGTKELRGTPAAAEPVASRVHWYEDGELAEMAKKAGFVHIRVTRPAMGDFARKAGLPPDAVAFFDAYPSGGQVLEARRGKEKGSTR